MNHPTWNPPAATKAIPRRRGFTLIELLVVIAVIALLAGMIFPITKALNRTKLRTRARGELAQLETVLERYKAKMGVYPPDNPAGPMTNQLYYELLGTTTQGGKGNQVFQTIDGRSKLDSTDAKTFFGTEGFFNSTRAGGGDDAPNAVNFFPGLNANQVGEVVNPKTGNPIRVIVSSVPWPEDQPYQPLQFKKGLNPWRYNSSHPVNNPNSYDLWVDILVDGKTNRISNWSKEPIFVNTPF